MVIIQISFLCYVKSTVNENLNIAKQELFCEVDVIFRGQSARENPLMQIRRHLHNHVLHITYAHVNARAHTDWLNHGKQRRSFHTNDNLFSL